MSLNFLFTYVPFTTHLLLFTISFIQKGSKNILICISELPLSTVRRLNNYELRDGHK